MARSDEVGLIESNSVVSGGEPGVADDVVDGGLVCRRGGAQLAGRPSGLGEFGECGREHSVVYAGEDHCGVLAGAGDAVAVGAGDALDEMVAAEPAEVVGDLRSEEHTSELP